MSAIKFLGSINALITKKQETIILSSLLIAAAIVSIYTVVNLNFFIGWHNTRFDDFASYLASAKLIRNGMGEHLYQVDTQLKVQREMIPGMYATSPVLPFRSIPLTAFLYSPFVNLAVFSELSKAIQLFSIFNMCVLFGLIYIVKKYLLNSMLAVYALIGFRALTFTFTSGQPSLLLLLVLIVSFLLLVKGRPVLSGLLVGLLLLKFNLFVPAALLLFVFSGKHYFKFLIGAGISLCVIYFSGVVLAGPHYFINIIQFILGTESARFSSPPYYYSLGSLFTNLLHIPLSIALFINYFVLVVFAFIFFIKRAQIDNDKALAIISLAVPVFAFHVYLTDVVFVLPYVIYLLKNYLNSKNTDMWAMLKFLLIFIIPSVLCLYYLEQTLLSGIYVVLPLFALLLL